MNILGINFSLDAAAVLMQNGRLVAAALEERFDRRKHSSAFPRQAIDYCLRRGGIGWQDVTAVAFSWNPAHHVAAPDRLRDTIYRDQREYLELVPAQLLAMRGDALPGAATQILIELQHGGLDVQYFDHHLCHAAGAFYASRFPQAAILTADGYGERTSTQLAVGGPDGIKVLESVPYPHSLGSVYAALTTYLGFQANNAEGKVMALAGMGNPTRFRSAFERMVRLTETGFEIDLSYFTYYLRAPRRYADRLVTEFGPPRRPDDPITKDHCDLAAALQEATERVLLHLAARAYRLTGMPQLCLAGGVALNAVAMGRLERESLFAEIFVLPPAHDGGGGLGAAWLLARQRGEKIIPSRPYTDRLGPAPDPDQVCRLLEEYGQRWSEPDDPPEAAAERIARGQVIGWMNGAMEYGPRALGARSILADPRDARMKDIVNAKVKYREAFRPFAPVAHEDVVDGYFAHARPTPFMNKVYQALPGVAARIPAVVHTDGSVRLQTVNADQDPALHALIAHFAARTGVPMVLNTSLNKRGQPICASLADALACFHTSGMDALFVDRFLIEK